MFFGESPPKGTFEAHEFLKQWRTYSDAYFKSFADRFNKRPFEVYDRNGKLLRAEPPLTFTGLDELINTGWENK